MKICYVLLSKHMLKILLCMMVILKVYWLCICSCSRLKYETMILVEEDEEHQQNSNREQQSSVSSKLDTRTILRWLLHLLKFQSVELL